MPFSITDFVANCSKIHVVDVGANPIDGDPPYQPLIQKDVASIVGFEPNLVALEKLRTQATANMTFLPHAIGDGNNHMLHVCRAEGLTSLLKPNEQVLSLFHGFQEWSQILRLEEVSTVRLDDVKEAQGMQFLKLDVQGAELMVLQHAQVCLQKTLVIHTEVEFMPMYEQQPLFSNVELFLRQCGFMFHRFGEVYSRTLRPVLVQNDVYAGLSQTVWADAIFVRDFVSLEKYSDADLIASSLIMHDCYGSYDLVFRFLLEHDRRRGTVLAQRYAEMNSGGVNAPDARLLG